MDMYREILSALTPPGFHSITGKRVDAVKNHILKMDDKALKFYDISTQQRDLFGSAYIQRDMSLNRLAEIFITIPKRNHRPSILMEFHESFLKIAEPQQYKIISHEIAHFFTYAQKSDLKSKNKYIDAYSRRLIETKADLFADKLVPEVTYKQVTQSCYGDDYVEKLIMQQKAMSYKDFFIKKLHDLKKAHPSELTRIKNSDKNCAKFLEYKQQHNIPSLING